MLDHHPHSTLAHFRRKLLSLLLVHGSILSKSGASGKPGAVQGFLYSRSRGRHLNEMRPFNLDWQLLQKAQVHHQAFGHRYLQLLRSA